MHWLPTHAHELPPEKQRAMRSAVRLEWISLAYFASAIAFTAAVMGASQAMKTAWIDDMLGAVPPIAFLVAAKLRHRPPSATYRYGYHRAVSIAFLVSAVALLGLGLALLREGVTTLVTAERATIAGVELFGRQIWLGWLMIAALVYSSVPTMILGRLKARLARALHDKPLHADAEMNRADWMTGLAGIFGVLGVGLGWWWADAVAAIAISADITVDGATNLRTAIGDLMDRTPRDVEGKRDDPLPGRLERAIAGLPWVRDVTVRLREHGHVLFGEAYVIPCDESAPLARIQQVRALADAMDWRLNDFTVQLIARPDDGDAPLDGPD